MFAVMPRTKIVFNIALIAVVLFNALIPNAASVVAALSDSIIDPATTSTSTLITTQGSKGLTVKLSSPARALLQDEITPTAWPTETKTSTPEPSSMLSPTFDGTEISIENTPTLVPSGTPIPTQLPSSSTGLSDISVQFSVTPSQAKTGDQVTFNVVIVNNGESPATGLRFSNTLPE